MTVLYEGSISATCTQGGSQFPHLGGAAPAPAAAAAPSAEAGASPPPAQAQVPPLSVPTPAAAASQLPPPPPLGTLPPAQWLQPPPPQSPRPPAQPPLPPPSAMPPPAALSGEGFTPAVEPIAPVQLAPGILFVPLNLASGGGGISGALDAAAAGVGSASAATDSSAGGASAGTGRRLLQVAEGPTAALPAASGSAALQGNGRIKSEAGNSQRRRLAAPLDPADADRAALVARFDAGSRGYRERDAGARCLQEQWGWSNINSSEIINGTVREALFLTQGDLQQGLKTDPQQHVPSLCSSEVQSCRTDWSGRDLMLLQRRFCEGTERHKPPTCVLQAHYYCSLQSDLNSDTCGFQPSAVAASGGLQLLPSASALDFEQKFVSVPLADFFGSLVLRRQVNVFNGIYPPNDAAATTDTTPCALICWFSMVMCLRCGVAQARASNLLRVLRTRSG